MDARRTGRDHRLGQLEGVERSAEAGLGVGDDRREPVGGVLATLGGGELVGAQQCVVDPLPPRVGRSPAGQHLGRRRPYLPTCFMAVSRRFVNHANIWHSVPNCSKNAARRLRGRHRKQCCRVGRKGRGIRHQGTNHAPISLRPPELGGPAGKF